MRKVGCSAVPVVKARSKVAPDMAAVRNKFEVRKTADF